MDSVSPAFSESIVDEAQSLRETFDSEELPVVFQGEIARIMSSQGVVLSAPSEQNLIQHILQSLGDEIVKNRVVASAIATQLVASVVTELSNQQIIQTDNIALYRFVIAVVTAMVLNALYKTWEEQRNDKANQES